VATQVQYRRGTSTQNDTFTGALGEITVDTTLNSLRVHNGSTAGGSKVISVNSQTGHANITGNLIPTANVTYDLGSPSQRWRTGYFASGTIDLGGSQISVDPTTGFSFQVAGSTTPVVLSANGVATSNTFTSNTITISSSLQSTHNTNGALVVVGGMGVSKDVFLGANLTVGGNLFINGNTTIFNANNLSINDSMIYLADDNPADTIDIGIVSAFTPGGGSYQHTGFVRDASDGVWKLFAGVTTEPTTTIDFTNATYSTIRIGNIYAGGTTANDNRFLQSTASGLAWTAATSISNGTTSATADTTSILITAENINSARFYKDVAYVYPDLELSANLTVSGVADITGNLSAAYFIGDGSQLTGIEGYSNVQAASYLKVYSDQINVASTTTAIINGGTNGQGNIGATGATFNTVFAKATTAQYADLAEIYTTDQQYPAGTVVVFGGEAEITQSHNTHDTRIAGVVSSNPAYLMNSTETGVPVALQGRVPCRVLGPVSKGDRVVSSHIPGVAQRLEPTQYEPGCIIGKALQAIDSTDISVIEVVVGRL
jgi:hypothetical protein